MEELYNWISRLTKSTKRLKEENFQFFTQKQKQEIEKLENKVEKATTLGEKIDTLSALETYLINYKNPIVQKEQTQSCGEFIAMIILIIFLLFMVFVVMNKSGMPNPR